MADFSDDAKRRIVRAVRKSEASDPPGGAGALSRQHGADLPLVGKADAEIAIGGTGTINLYRGQVKGSEAFATGDTIQAYNRLGPTIAAGDWCWLEWRAGGYEIVRSSSGTGATTSSGIGCETCSPFDCVEPPGVDLAPCEYCACGSEVLQLDVGTIDCLGVDVGGRIFVQFQPGVYYDNVGDCVWESPEIGTTDRTFLWRLTVTSGSPNNVGQIRLVDTTDTPYVVASWTNDSWCCCCENILDADCPYLPVQCIGLPCQICAAMPEPSSISSLCTSCDGIDGGYEVAVPALGGEACCSDADNATIALNYAYQGPNPLGLPQCSPCLFVSDWTAVCDTTGGGSFEWFARWELFPVLDSSGTAWHLRLVKYRNATGIPIGDVDCLTLYNLTLDLLGSGFEAKVLLWYEHSGSPCGVTGDYTPVASFTPLCTGGPSTLTVSGASIDPDAVFYQDSFDNVIVPAITDDCPGDDCGGASTASCDAPPDADVGFCIYLSDGETWTLCRGCADIAHPDCACSEPGANPADFAGQFYLAGCYDASNFPCWH